MRRGAVCAVLLLAGCTVGPDYHRPAAPVSLHYKEARGWKLGQPQPATPRGPWWRIYRDATLDRLEPQVAVSNQNLRAAAAAFREAEALVGEARAGFFPTLAASDTGQRSRSAGGRTGQGVIGNFFAVNTSASWVPDLWGKVRRSVESQVESAQASAGDLANLELSAESALASDYFQLRAADALRRLLGQTIADYSESLRIARNQAKAGIAAPSDVAQAEAQLAAAKAQQIALGVSRADLEHAIAVLTGRPPAALTLASGPLAVAVPAIPPGLPSALLERRPDIAAAERRMAAANAQIGVAKAAFFPSLTLSANAGSEAAQIAQLASASNLVWGLGSNLAGSLFEGGLRKAQVAAARAVYAESVAQYRQTVLGALQQVEDELAALRILAQQERAEDRAVAAARAAERVITNQYKAGLVPYTNVVVAQATVLSDAETALQIRENRLVASVGLIEALGGGWNTRDLPSKQQIERALPILRHPFPSAAAASAAAG